MSWKSAMLATAAVVLMVGHCFSAPELIVRMGYFHLVNNDAPEQFAGTLQPNVAVGETRTINLLLENRGNQNLNIANPAVLSGSGASQFHVTFGPDALLEPGQGAFLIVQYTPSAVGTHDAVLQLDSNDVEDAVFHILLHGECVATPATPLTDLLISGTTVKTKCNEKKQACITKSKSTIYNLATAINGGFIWWVVPTGDGMIRLGSPTVTNGVGKGLKAYKGFPAPFPKKNLNTKTTSGLSATVYVLFVAPLEGDLDYSNNSVLLPI